MLVDFTRGVPMRGEERAMDENLLVLRLMEESKEGGIACTAALRLAEEIGVPPRALGDVANRLGIKIRACQLGCF